MQSSFPLLSPITSSIALTVARVLFRMSPLSICSSFLTLNVPLDVCGQFHNPLSYVSCMKTAAQF